MRKALVVVAATFVACGTPGTGGTSGGSAGSGGSGGSGGSAGTGGSGGSGGSGGATAGGGATGGGSAGGTAGGAAGGSAGGMGWVGPDGGISSRMSFFCTSRGMGLGGDMRGDAGDGLTGADRFCTQLAAAIDPGLGAKTWRAYLSTSTVNARDRIGSGPWRNAKDVIIANNVAHLHDDAGVNGLDGGTNLDERGLIVPFTGT